VRRAEGDHAGDQNGSDGVPCGRQYHCWSSALYLDSRRPLRSDEHDCATEARFGLAFNESSGACLTRSVAARSKPAHLPTVRIARLYAHAGDKEQVLY
jgi:hypothetical protein